MSGPENPSAFPFQGNDGCGSFMEPGYGMTLRDWFAGQALAGYGDTPRERSDDTRARRMVLCRQRADDIYRMADAMLAARAGK